MSPPHDARLIYATRALRDFGDGLVALLLPVYLAARGLNAFEIGVVATLALLGSALMTLAIGAISTRFGDRALLLAAATLMTATGVAFIAASETWIIFLIAFVGTANPSAGTASIFIPLEHAVLARSVADRARTHSFAFYGLVGALAAALGSLAAASPEWLARAGLTQLNALHLMFGVYAALGLASAALFARIAPDPEHETKPKPAPLTKSRAIVLKLAALFSVDSFAGGFVVPTLLALWLFTKFQLSLADAGLFFMAAGLLGALSQPAAAWLSTRIGLVNTMVWTHIPANLALIGAAFAPSLDLAFTLLLVRALLSQMDVPARSSYVMAVVTPEERGAAASITAVPRSLAAAAAPAIAGLFFAAGHADLALIFCGVLKITYDVALLTLFRNVRPPEEIAGAG